MPDKPRHKLTRSQEAALAIATGRVPEDVIAAGGPTRLTVNFNRPLRLAGDLLTFARTGLGSEGFPPPFPPPGGDGRTLTFAQTEAGARLTASLARDTERFRGKERLKLEDTLFDLAKELLPPADVETAMRQVRRGELVKSKLAFQSVLQNLTDAAANAERRADIALAEENEKRTLREARAKITIDMIGKDLGRAVLFALSGGE